MSVRQSIIEMEEVVSAMQSRLEIPTEFIEECQEVLRQALRCLEEEDEASAGKELGNLKSMMGAKEDELKAQRAKERILEEISRQSTSAFESLVSIKN